MMLKMLAIAAALSSIGATSRPATQPTTKITSIFWEKQVWGLGGGKSRLTLWADGRSEITVRRRRPAAPAKPGWTMTKDDDGTVYHKASPLSAEESRKKFADAITAGIAELKTFAADYSDGGGTLVGIENDGKIKQIVIPMFIHPDEPDNKGSENHKRFLAVQKVIGEFDTNAVADDAKPGT